MKRRIGTLLSVALIVVFVAGVTGCSKSETPPPSGVGATTRPADTVATVNAKCPVMGGKLNAARVPADLVRDFGGKKVGFCCAGCIPKWEAFSDAEKATKLAAVMVPAP